MKSRRGGTVVRIRIAFLVVTSLAGVEAGAQELKGYGELVTTGSWGVDGFPVQFVQRFRPELSAPLGERLQLVSTVQIALVEGRDTTTVVRGILDDSDVGPLLDAAGCDWPENANEFFDVDRIGDYLWVDRLYLDAYLPWVDIRVGRQAILWGSALFFNPTNPFPQILLTQPWRARQGINAARMTFPIGERHQIQVLGATDDLFRYGRAAARGTLNVAETDFTLVGVYRGDNQSAVAGLDIRGTLGVGFWFEGSMHVSPLRKGEAPEVWEELAVGIDYSFPLLEGLTLAAQYYRNGRDAEASSLSGLAGAVEMPDCLDDVELFPEASGEADPFAPFVTGRDYGLFSVSLGATRDVSISATMLQNFGDGSGMMLPMVSVRPTGWSELSLQMQLPYDVGGDGGEFRPASDDLVIAGPLPDQSIDFSGLVPRGTALMWARAEF